MKRHFTYEAEFVCISVRGDDETSNLADAYGFQFELRQEIIDEIKIVCVWDFQNVVSAANERLERGEGIDEYLKYFEVLPDGAGRAEREGILMNALSKCKEAGYPYSEARIYRRLRRTDCIDPDSGKLGWIWNDVLEENEED
jgi:hypothetical protein